MMKDSHLTSKHLTFLHMATPLALALDGLIDLQDRDWITRYTETCGIIGECTRCVNLISHNQISALILSYLSHQNRSVSRDDTEQPAGMFKTSVSSAGSHKSIPVNPNMQQCHQVTTGQS